MWQQSLYPEEQRYTQGMVDKRRAEFQAGRACARRVLAELDVVYFPLLRNEDRAPIWPTGVVGSISHCDDVCWAVAAKTNEVQGLGADVEAVRSDINLPVELICSDGEALVALAAQFDCSVSLKLVFSAKESVMKAYYSATGALLEFLDICLHFDDISRQFEVISIRNATFRVKSLTGRYFINESHIFTAAEIIVAD